VVWKEAIAQARVVATDRFDVCAVRPRQVLAPAARPDAAAMRAEYRTERGELKPAHEQLGRLGHGVEEAANVRAPVWDSRHGGAQAERELRLEHVERIGDIA